MTSNYLEMLLARVPLQGVAVVVVSLLLPLLVVEVAVASASDSLIQFLSFVLGEFHRWSRVSNTCEPENNNF